MKQIYELEASGNYKEAVERGLQSDASLPADATAEQRGSVARAIGLLYYKMNVPDKAYAFFSKALRFAEEAGDTAHICSDSYNLALMTTDTDEALRLLSRAETMASAVDDNAVRVASLVMLSSIYCGRNQFDKAQEYVDKAKSLSDTDEAWREETDIKQLDILLGRGKYPEAREGWESQHNLNVNGQLQRARTLSFIAREEGDYDRAFLYRDSAEFWVDSIHNLDGRKDAEAVEAKFSADMARKSERFARTLWIGAGVFAALVVILIIALRNLRLRRHQVELTSRIAALSARLAEARSKDERNAITESVDTDSQARDKEKSLRLLEQKFELSRELFRTLPESVQLKKLSLLHDFTPASRGEIKGVFDCMAGRFADCCTDLRTLYPALTADDCLYCALVYAGCRKEFASVCMSASEEALRRRKSRIKQKLPEDAFAFFFG